VPSRYPRKSLYKSISRIATIDYYRCPNCKLTGIIVLSGYRFNCGAKHCRAWLHIAEARITKKEYELVWGLSIS